MDQKNFQIISITQKCILIKLISI